MSIYDFRVRLASGPEISISDYMRKVLLIVNVASNCIYTSQYQDLEMLYRIYKKRGLFILDFLVINLVYRNLGQMRKF